MNKIMWSAELHKLSAVCW